MKVITTTFSLIYPENKFSNANILLTLYHGIALAIDHNDVLCGDKSPFLSIKPLLNHESAGGLVTFYL